MLLSRLLAAVLGLCASDKDRVVSDIELPDQHGTSVRLADFNDTPLVAVVFLGTKCPLAKLYAPKLQELANQYKSQGVAFLAINSNGADSPDDVTNFAQQSGIQFPILRDGNAAIAEKFGATRQLEVFVLDRQRRVRYHGRVDDQYAPGVRRSAPTRNDLELALDQLLDGQEVAVPETEVLGCLIDRPQPAPAATQVTYSRDIAPILNQRCALCHRPGQIGPFSLTTYQDAAAWSATIHERIADGSMPPWHADPRIGSFANDRRLTDRERQLIDEWISGGLPAGNPRDLPAAPTFSDEWNIGTPDLIVKMSEAVAIPGSGIMENIAIELDPKNREDLWICGTEVRPGNRSVVHHCTVFIGPPGLRELVDSGKPGLYYFSDFVPGLMPALLPAGLARRLPAGWHIYFSLHYVPNGIATTDQTSLGLVFAQNIKHEVFTHNLLNNQFRIEPYEADKQVEQSWIVPRDTLLLSLFPHMHLRGKSFRYEAIYPGGAIETLLSVPKYDFLWQHRYVLAEPKRLPAGTTLRAVAVFDNSAGNPANPDPSATVTYGKLTTDEMFHGYFDAAFLEAPRSSGRSAALLIAVLVTIGCWAALRRPCK